MTGLLTRNVFKMDEHNAIHIIEKIFSFQWGAETVPVPAVPIQPGYGATKDWSAASEHQDWSAPTATAGTTNEWGGSGHENWG